MENEDTNANTNTNTNTNKHNNIGVLICFTLLLHFVVASLSRLHDSVPPRFAPPFATQILCRFEQQIRTAIRDTNIMSIRAASARESEIAEPR